MAGKEQQRHITDLPIHEADTDHDDDTPGSICTSHMADISHISPDEYAAAVTHSAPSIQWFRQMTASFRHYARRARARHTGPHPQLRQPTWHRPERSLCRLDKLAQAIQRHPWFEEITAPFRTIRRPA